MGISKRFFALTLVMLLVMLAGCGKVSEADKTDAKPQTLDDKVNQ